MQKIIAIISIGLSLLGLAACHGHQTNKNMLTVGVISGPEVALMEAAKGVLTKQFGMNVKIVEFTDYTMPNAALNDGSIDANIFQHQPFLDQQIQDRGYQLVVVAKTFIFPMGLYSQKIKKLDQIPANAIVAIPNDPSNEGRALLLLQKANLIRLKTDAGLYATPTAIIDNPKHLKFKELDAAQIARALPDVTLAAINTNYAMVAGLYPKRDALFIEDKDSPYANIIVVRRDEVDNPQIKELIVAYHSAAVVKEAQKIFNNQAIVAWKQ